MSKLNVDVDLSTPVLMFLVFLLLKCADVIDWSWVWVFSPLYIGIGLIIISIIVSLIITVICGLIFRNRGGGGIA